jgi:hypothetical protein
VIILIDPHHLSRVLLSTDTPIRADTADSDEGTVSSGVAEYLAKLFQLHIWMKPITAQESHYIMAAVSWDQVLRREEADLLQLVGTVLRSPRQARKLVISIDSQSSYCQPSTLSVYR